MFVDSIYKFNKLYAPYLVQESHFLFKYEKKVAISKKKSGKIVGSHPQYQKSLISVICKSLAWISGKSAESILYKKSVVSVYCSHKTITYTAGFDTNNIIDTLMASAI